MRASGRAWASLYEELPLADLDSACRYLDKALCSLAQRHYCYAMVGQRFGVDALPPGRSALSIEAHFMRAIVLSDSAPEPYLQYAVFLRDGEQRDFDGAASALEAALCLAAAQTGASAVNVHIEVLCELALLHLRARDDIAAAEALAAHAASLDPLAVRPKLLLADLIVAEANALIECSRSAGLGEADQLRQLLPPAKAHPGPGVHCTETLIGVKARVTMHLKLRAAIERVYCGAAEGDGAYAAFLRAAPRDRGGLITADALHSVLKRAAAGESASEVASDGASGARGDCAKLALAGYPPCWFNDEASSATPRVAVFHCPITQKRMHDPVCNSHGRAYERSAIKRWLAEGPRQAAAPTAAAATATAAAAAAAAAAATVTTTTAAAEATSAAFPAAPSDDEILEDLVADAALRAEIDGVDRVATAFGVDGLSSAQLERILYGDFALARPSAAAAAHAPAAAGVSTHSLGLGRVLAKHVDDARRALQLGIEQCLALGPRSHASHASVPASSAQHWLQRARAADAHILERIGDDGGVATIIKSWEKTKADRGIQTPHSKRAFDRDVGAFIMGARLHARCVTPTWRSSFVDTMSGEWRNIVSGTAGVDSGVADETSSEHRAETRRYVGNAVRSMRSRGVAADAVELAKRRATLAQIKLIEATLQLSTGARAGALDSITAALNLEPYEARLWTLLASMTRGGDVSWFAGYGSSSGVDRDGDDPTSCESTVALNCLERVVAIDPCNVLARFQLACLHEEVGRWTRAEVGFACVLASLESVARGGAGAGEELHRHFRVHVHLRLAHIELKRGDGDGARAQYARALTIFERHIEGKRSPIAASIREQVLSELAALIMQEQRGGDSMAEARELLERALRARGALSFAHHSSTHGRRAELLAQEGDNAGAEVHCRYAVAAAPSDAEHHKSLAAALLRNGDKSGAEMHLHIALALRPEGSCDVDALLQRSRCSEGEARAPQILRVSDDLIAQAAAHLESAHLELALSTYHTVIVALAQIGTGTTSGDERAARKRTSSAYVGIASACVAAASDKTAKIEALPRFLWEYRVRNEHDGKSPSFAALDCVLEHSRVFDTGAMPPSTPRVVAMIHRCRLIRIFCIVHNALRVVANLQVGDNTFAAHHLASQLHLRASEVEALSSSEVHTLRQLRLSVNPEEDRRRAGELHAPPRAAPSVQARSELLIGCEDIAFAWFSLISGYEIDIDHATAALPEPSEWPLPRQNLEESVRRIYARDAESHLAAKRAPALFRIARCNGWESAARGAPKRALLSAAAETFLCAALDLTPHSGEALITLGEVLACSAQDAKDSARARWLCRSAQARVHAALAVSNRFHERGAKALIFARGELQACGLV